MTDTTSTTQLSSARRGADTVFFWLTVLLVLAVIVQFFLAGVGVFGVNHLNVTKAGFNAHKVIEDANSFDPHRVNGFIIEVLSLLLLIAALVAHISKRVMWTSFVLALLAIGAQGALAAGGDSHKWVGGLHALDGVIIMGIIGWLHVNARRRTRSS